MQNSPGAGSARAVECLRAGDSYGPTIAVLRRQFLTQRYHVHPAALAALSEHAWGVRCG